jgi:SAM-dependent methyltransferase
MRNTFCHGLMFLIDIASYCIKIFTMRGLLMIRSEYAQMNALEQDFWWYKGLHELVEVIIQRHSSGDTNLKILDAGCGTGRMMQIACSYGSVHGIDYAQEAVFFCKKNGLQNVSRQDLNDWNPEKNHYDIIISLDVLYHAAIKNDADIIRKFSRALKKDGICIVNLPAFPVLFRNHDLAVFTKKRYRKKETVKLFTTAGFEIQLVSYRLPHLFFLILLKKINQFFFFKKEKSDLQALPKWLNKCLYQIVRIENMLILAGMPMPFGSSLFLVARKGESLEDVH